MASLLDATPPPEIDPNDQYAQNHDPRYAGDPVPEAECLANVVERVKPYFESAIEPELRAGKTVLIAAHGNSLRAIVKMLDNLSEDEIAKVNIPTAIPLLYELDENFKPVKPRGEYLYRRPPPPVPPPSQLRARSDTDLALA